ncbi:hypothetical protein [Streptomyces sp. NPDC093105]|uniref:hypothetical protein n=1 Tax=Streptomyces sp. NPDC093105 TaxID=3366029 RepID=UPI00382BB518
MNKTAADVIKVAQAIGTARASDQATRRGLRVFLGTASVPAAVSWSIAGPAYLPWAILAALLVARVTSRT